MSTFTLLMRDLTAKKGRARKITRPITMFKLERKKPLKKRNKIPIAIAENNEIF